MLFYDITLYSHRKGFNVLKKFKQVWIGLIWYVKTEVKHFNTNVIVSFVILFV